MSDLHPAREIIFRGILLEANNEEQHSEDFCSGTDTKLLPLTECELYHFGIEILFWHVVEPSTTDFERPPNVLVARRAGNAPTKVLGIECPTQSPVAP